MGDEVTQVHYSREQRQHYRQKVRRCLDVFRDMVDLECFGPERPTAGLEVELNLVGDDGRPYFGNRTVLEEIADPAFQTELGAFNIELNMPPCSLVGDGLIELERDLRTALNRAETRASAKGAHTVMVGILPTLGAEDVTNAGWMSDSPRYAALNDSILAARGEDLLLDIRGVEQLQQYADTLAPEAACTSVQLHLPVEVARFADVWNAAQALAGPQAALGANSPFFLGRRLWHETRLEVFQQAVDTRPPELKNQGVRPRVWFGERWIDSLLDLFEENVHYFPALLPEVTDEDPAAELAAGRIPRLQELRLHNGTVYRWNRPVYDVVDGRPHVRLENRVLPAGPTVVDVVANAAFYYGAVGALAAEGAALPAGLPFAAAADNLRACARDGLGASCRWPGVGTIGVAELLLTRLLPLAHEGLDRWGVAPAVRDHLLGVVERRAATGRNGATWQAATVAAFEERGLDRHAALEQMLRLYCEGMHANAPVHTWPVPGGPG